VIGIIDSGLGGMTLYHAIKRGLPGVPILYYADTENLPYGNKSPKTLTRHVEVAIDYLIQEGALLIVLACHTAAIHANVKPLYIPIVSIAPFAVQALSNRPELERVVLLGTHSTINSFYFQERLPGRELFPIAAPLFVSIVEEGLAQHPLADAVAYTYLSSLKSKNIDAALLACTHFPFLKESIIRSIGSDIELIDPTQLCAEEVMRMAQIYGIDSLQGEDRFVSSGANSEIIEQFKRGTFYGSEKENFAHRR